MNAKILNLDTTEPLRPSIDLEGRDRLMTKELPSCCTLGITTQEAVNDRGYAKKSRLPYTVFI